MRLALLASLALACEGSLGVPRDAGRFSDAGPSDAGARDPERDAGSTDPGPMDAGSDPAVPDAGSTDPGPMDAGSDPVVPDAGPVEPPDAGLPPRCPTTSSCSAAMGTATEHRMRSIDGCAFVFNAPSGPDDARVNALVAKAGGAMTITDVLGYLNRVGRQGISSRNAERMKNHAWVGFRWNDGDENVSYWYPQGITGSSDARADGNVDGRRLFLVSWYHKTDARPTRGARISLVDFTDPSSIRYRHLLLVTPTGTAANPNFGPVETGSGNALHAGGIVWFGNLLYVADTTQGFRVFDLSRIFELSNTDCAECIGFSGSRSDAHGYRFAVPQIARYRLASDSCTIRFSFVGLDRSESPPLLISGEYFADHANGRIARWAIDPSTGWLIEENGRVYAHDAVLAAQTRMQGGLTYEGVYYISSSSQTASSWGRLYRTRPGLESAITAWPYGCEDLYVERDRHLIWTPAEHPGFRDTLGIPMQGR